MQIKTTDLPRAARSSFRRRPLNVRFAARQSFWSIAIRTNRRANGGLPRGFTVLEVLIVIALLVMLIIAGIGATTAMQMSSRRLTDHTSARAVVQGRLQAVRAASYRPPNYPFTAGVVYITNDASICLNRSGGAYLVSGQVTTKIEPVAAGHLVTVTGRFPIGNRVTSVELSSVVNRFSGGEQ